MGDNANARSVLRKIIITAVLGGISFPFTQLLFPTLPGQVTMAAAFGGIVLLVQFLIDFEMRLAKVEQQQVESVTEMLRVVENGFAQIVDATQLFSRVKERGLAESMADVAHQAARIELDSSSLVPYVARREIDRTAEFLRGLADQEVSRDGEEHQWLMDLTQGAQTSIDSISIPEVDGDGQSFRGYWDEEAGTSYLELQREAIKRGVRIRRVFVPRSGELDDPVLQATCRDQEEMGVEIRLLNPAAMSHATRISVYGFIVFDNKVSYELIPALYRDERMGPRIQSTLIRRGLKIPERIANYERIWSSAKPWSPQQVNAPSVDLWAQRRDQ